MTIASNYASRPATLAGVKARIKEVRKDIDELVALEVQYLNVVEVLESLSATDDAGDEAPPVTRAPVAARAVEKVAAPAKPAPAKKAEPAPEPEVEEEAAPAGKKTRVTKAQVEKPFAESEDTSGLPVTDRILALFEVGGEGATKADVCEQLPDVKEHTVAVTLSTLVRTGRLDKDGPNLYVLPAEAAE